MKVLLLALVFSAIIAQSDLAAFTANSDFQFYPQYAPKNSTPFAFNVCYSSLDANANYDLKATLGSSDGSSQASKTWSGSAWVSSNNYGPTLTANSTGDFCSLIYLQANPSASAYSSLLENSATAYITAKLRKTSQTSNTSGVSSVQINLLDLCDDNSCYGTGGTAGGWLEGFYPSLAAGSLVKIKNNSDTLSIYTLEDNSVSENYKADTGYFKLASPEGNFTLEISDSSGSILKAENISILRNETTYSGNVLYFLISSNIEQEEFGENYRIAPNNSYQVFLIENLEYSKILGQDLSKPAELNFSWNVTNATNPSQVFFSSSTIQNFTESLNSGDWTPTADGNYTACGQINYAKTNGEGIYNIAPRWASPEAGDYGDAYCINIAVGLERATESCNFLSGIETEDDIFEKGNAVQFTIRLNSTSSHQSALHWWIEDSSGNKVAKKYFSTKANSSTFLVDKAWAPKKTGAYTIKANLTDVGCSEQKESFSEKQITVIDKDNMDISAKVDKTSYNASETANISVQITNGFSTEKKGTLTLLVKRRLSIFGYNETIASEQISIPALSTATKNYLWQIPADAISGEYKIKVSFAYEKTKSKYPAFAVSGLQDLGEPAIEILSVPQAKFGEFALVFAKYSANNYNLPLKFLSYLYSPWLSTDLSGEILKSNLENSSVLASLNTSRNSTYYLLLPIILKNNCEAKLSDGSYSAKTRAYFSSSPLLDKNFNLSILGSNSARCPTFSEKTVEKIRDLGGVKKVVEKIYEKLPENMDVEIGNLAGEIAGRSVDFSVFVRNRANSTKTIDVYSFVEGGGEIFSLSEISTKRIAAGAAEAFSVRNKIPVGAEGNYTLRIRVSDGERAYEIEREIEVQKEISGKNNTRVGSDGPTGGFLFGASALISDIVNGILKMLSSLLSLS